LSTILEVAAVVGTSVGMSHRTAGEEKTCIACCCGVGCNIIGSFSNWLSVGGVEMGEGLALWTGMPSKVTMVMMTSLAFLVETHID